jgi:dynein heavy chain
LLQEYRDRIFSRFETSIIDSAREISDRYVQISTYIRRSLKAPDDVEAMEKYISDLTGDRIQLKQRTTDVFQRLLFMLKQNFKASESLLTLAEELHNRPALLDRELIEQEEKHAVER